MGAPPVDPPENETDPLKIAQKELDEGKVCLSLYEEGGL